MPYEAHPPPPRRPMTSGGATTTSSSCPPSARRVVSSARGVIDREAAMSSLTNINNTSSMNHPRQSPRCVLRSAAGCGAPKFKPDGFGAFLLPTPPPEATRFSQTVLPSRPDVLSSNECNNCVSDDGRVMVVTPAMKQPTSRPSLPLLLGLQENHINQQQQLQQKRQSTPNTAGRVYFSSQKTRTSGGALTERAATGRSSTKHERQHELARIHQQQHPYRRCLCNLCEFVNFELDCFDHRAATNTNLTLNTFFDSSDDDDQDAGNNKADGVLSVTSSTARRREFHLMKTTRKLGVDEPPAVVALLFRLDSLRVSRAIKTLHTAFQYSVDDLKKMFVRFCDMGTSAMAAGSSDIGMRQSAFTHFLQHNCGPLERKTCGDLYGKFFYGNASVASMVDYGTMFTYWQMWFGLKPMVTAELLISLCTRYTPHNKTKHDDVTPFELRALVDTLQGIFDDWECEEGSSLWVEKNSLIRMLKSDLESWMGSTTYHASTTSVDSRTMPSTSLLYRLWHCRAFTHSVVALKVEAKGVRDSILAAQSAATTLMSAAGATPNFNLAVTGGVGGLTPRSTTMSINSPSGGAGIRSKIMQATIARNKQRGL
eukprot:PhM_4_TR17530/c0_g1_i1/m.15155